ncbi:retroviral-like aspartic protease family protein [Sphingomonas lenta]|nr:retroviral-like aspartic protease family protein [Sphingomonas lenta]
MRKLVPALLLAAAVPATAEPLEVLPTGHPVAQVRLGDRGPYRFVIDTAASNTSLLPRLADQLPELRRDAADAPLNAASGRTTTQIAKLPRFVAHGRTFRDLPAFLLPAGPVDALGVDGVLGADVVSTYALEIDAPGRRWSLLDAPTPTMLRGTLPPVPFTLDAARAPRVTVMLNGKPVPAILDTGARATFVNWAAARLAGVTPDTPGLSSGGEAKGVSRHATPTASTTFEVAVGEYQRPAAKVRIADLPIFALVGMGNGPAMILGIDAFADRRIVIDHPRGQLHIAR